MDPGSPSVYYQLPDIKCTICKKLRSPWYYRSKDKKRQVKTCSLCRDRQAAYERSAAGRATVKRYRGKAETKARAAEYRKSDARKLPNAKNLKKHRSTEKYKTKRREHRKSDAHREYMKRYMSSDVYRAMQDRRYKRIHDNPGKHLEHAICVLMGKMLHGHDKSKTVARHSEFVDSEDLVDHFEKQFPPGSGMTRDNHGMHTWHIGHRIARAMYDTSLEEDVHRCWKRANLFPQAAKENWSAGVALPDTAKLLELRDCWPVGWNDKLPSTKERVLLEKRARGGAHA